MQTVTTSALMAGVLFANAGLLSAADKPTVKKVYKETNGVWKLVSKIEDGTPTPAEELKDIRMELKNGKWTGYKAKEQVGTGLYKIVSVKNGIRLVAGEILTGKNAGRKGMHISKSEGDKLIVCHGPDRKVAPKKFTAKKGTGNRLYVWKRVK